MQVKCLQCSSLDRVPFLNQKVLKIKSTQKKSSGFTAVLLLHLLFTFTIRIIFSIDSLLLFWASFQFSQNIATKKKKIRAIKLLLSSSWPNMCHFQLNPISLLPLIHQYCLTNFVLVRQFFARTNNNFIFDVYHVSDETQQKGYFLPICLRNGSKGWQVFAILKIQGLYLLS